jgi:hypothetical protein
MLSAPVSASVTIGAPGGLSVGDKFHWVFVTSQYYPATSSDIHHYNDVVNAAAAAASVEVECVVANGIAVASLGDIEWRVIASTASVDARDNIGDPMYGIFRLDGLKVANDEADLFDGSIQNPILITENVEQGLNTYVWTGSHADGTALAGYTLGGSAPNYNVRVGSKRLTDARWIEYPYGSFYNASDWICLYAISEELVYVPLPGCALLVLVGLTSCSLARFSRRRRRS